MNLENCELFKIVLSVDATESTETQNTFEFSQTATTSLDEFDSVADAIGFYVSLLLKSMGFHRENDYLFMESVTERERCFLEEALEKYREHIGGVK